MKKRLLLALFAFAALPVIAENPAPAKAVETATPAGWSDDFESAQKQAADAGKDLLVAFSGSDWCGWCVRLEKEVFSQGDFTEKVREHFVSVYVDYPQDKNRLSPAAKRQNAALVARYQIERFPAVVLMDADGDVVAQTGYAEGGPEKYLAMLLKLRDDGKQSPAYKAQKSLRKVSEGATRIAELDRILKALPLNLQIANIAFVREVLEADFDGSRGFRKNYPYFTDVLPLENALKAELAKLSEITQAVLARKGIPAEKAEIVKIIVGIVRENSRGLLTLREQAQNAQKALPENTPARQRLDRILGELDYIFLTYFDEANCRQKAEK